MTLKHPKAPAGLSNDVSTVFTLEGDTRRIELGRVPPLTITALWGDGAAGRHPPTSVSGPQGPFFTQSSTASSSRGISRAHRKRGRLASGLPASRIRAWWIAL